MIRSASAVETKTLSARGSKMRPNLDFCLKILAINPSKKSVKPATSK